MTLTAGLSIAKSALAAFSTETAVVSRNLASAGDEGYVRRGANITTPPGGGVRVVSVTRSTDKLLFDRLLNVSSNAAGEQAILDALSQLERTIGDPELGQSPTALIGELENALQLYSDAPNDLIRAQAAIVRANELTSALNNASTTVQQIRAQADSDMAASVDNINSLLAQFEEVNTTIVKSQHLDGDLNDQLDIRDGILRQLSEEIGIRTVPRTDNDIAIFTDSGVTLFEKTARPVTYQSTDIYVAGLTGNAVYVDGVPVTGDTAVMPIRSGRLVGLSAIRDTHTVTYQTQLDEIARGLIETFAEQDQSVPPSLPDATGLFTYPGGPAVPPTGIVSTGLASQITVNASVDPAQGGNAVLLRDGGIAGAAYAYNVTGAVGFPDRLQELLGNLSDTRSFDPAAGTTAAASISGYASSSVSWFENLRQTTESESSYQNAIHERATQALSQATGVNVDEEMTILLELERSYEASARLMSAIDSMYAALLQAAG